MKAKPFRLDHNLAGLEVQRLLKEDGTANAELKGIRSAKAARKEQLKSALTVVWQAFEKGSTVNGCATRKQWCKEFAKVTPRHCEHIIYGRKPEANKRSRVVTLKDGDIVNMKRSDGENWYVEKFKVIDNGVHGIWLKKVEEEKPAPVTHARNGGISKVQSVCEHHYINMPRIKGKVWAAKYGEATCPKCRTTIDKKIPSLKEQHEAIRSKVADTAAQRLEKVLDASISVECPNEEAL